MHAFNGWADKFLRTPVNGLGDLYVGASGLSSPITWAAAYHDFRAATGVARYGGELDFLLSYRSPWSQTFAIKGAVYDADAFSTDTYKIWLWTAYRFPG